MTCIMRSPCESSRRAKWKGRVGSVGGEPVDEQYGGGDDAPPEQDDRRRSRSTQRRLAMCVARKTAAAAAPAKLASGSRTYGAAEKHACLWVSFADVCFRALAVGLPGFLTGMKNAVALVLHAFCRLCLWRMSTAHITRWGSRRCPGKPEADSLDAASVHRGAGIRRLPSTA